MLAAEARLAPTLRPTWSEARLERLRAAAEALEFEEALAVIDEARTR
jgi:hypothetical protein